VPRNSPGQGGAELILAGYEKSQMITVASGRPIPNDQPMIIASAKSKPTPARNAGNDMPLLL
jgi:hypothetical protein